MPTPSYNRDVRHVVVLDASVLRQESPLGSLSIQLRRLKAAREEKVVQILVHTIVWQEWTSKVQTELSKTLASVKKAASQGLCGDLALLKVPDLDAHCKALARERTYDMLYRRLGVNVLGIEQTDAGRVFAWYFRGEPPFREPRLKEHIPDAFILAAILRLLKTGEYSRIWLATLDNGLMQAAKHYSVEAYSSLSEIVNALRSEHPSRSDDAVKWRAANERRIGIATHDGSPLHAEVVRRLHDALKLQTWNDFAHGFAKTRVIGVGNPRKLELHAQEAEFPVSGIVEIPFFATIPISLGIEYQPGSETRIRDNAIATGHLLLEFDVHQDEVGQDPASAGVLAETTDLADLKDVQVVVDRFVSGLNDNAAVLVPPMRTR